MPKLYEVKYLVTREEVYRVAAEDELEAQNCAFMEGQFIETQETVSVMDAGITLVTKN